MSLRARIALVAALAVTLAVVAVSTAAYLTTRSTLRGQIDRDLADRANGALRDLAHGGDRGGGRGGGPFGGPEAGRFGGPGVFRQLVDVRGETLRLPVGQDAIPVDAQARRAAAGGAGGYSEVTVSGTRLRVLAVPVGSGMALQVARPLDEVDANLTRLRNRLLVVSLAGVAFSAVLGALVAARGVRPVTRLTESLEHVARTRDLTHRVPVTGHDEPARLAGTFNDMLESLDQARTAQEQLVADASHELRTPLAALRTNAELLASGVEIPPQERRGIAHDVAAQIDGFGRLVADLVELTRGERPAAHAEPLRLDELAHDVVARARVHHPGIDFVVAASPAHVVADATALERALGNLVENAVRHGAGPVEVHVADGTVRVRDHGAGIADVDKPRVFARFWRADDARGREGSGLGLAIVQQVARAHGGTVDVHDAAGGGAEFVLSLPVGAGADGDAERRGS